jgi:hypothetical protein
VQDPAQAWNVVTVGACTQKDRIHDVQAAHHPVIAPQGGLSPMSATSCNWNPDWPIKPDIVVEGGNQYREGGRLWKHPDLELLTTNAQFNQRRDISHSSMFSHRTRKRSKTGFSASSAH